MREVRWERMFSDELEAARARRLGMARELARPGTVMR